MKIIFLDVDGVLNCHNTFKKQHEKYIKTGIWEIEIELSKVKLLKQIVDNTNAKIVLSSTWRLSWLYIHLTIAVSHILLFHDLGF